jgi:hypothetical protein
MQMTKSKQLPKKIAERYNRSKHVIKYKSTYPGVAHLVMHELVQILSTKPEKKTLTKYSFQPNKTKQFY